MITNIIDAVAAQLEEAIASASVSIDVVKFDGFIKTDAPLENKILSAVRFIEAVPSSTSTGTGETMGLIRLGVLIRHRLDPVSYDLVVDTAEFIAAWLKWNRFNLTIVSSRGSTFEAIRSASQEFGTPALEVVFSLNALLESTLTGAVKNPYPFDDVIAGGPLTTVIEIGPGSSPTTRVTVP